ncbi:hypothetical protein Bbelb_425020 [Branchiostoma belcheri]|nr:hypothetical protein Bbelb_425020 [Branchiostoma belcheri]
MTSGIGIVGPDRSQLTLVSSSITCSKLPLDTWALTKCEKTKADNRLASVKVSVGFGWTPKGIFVKYSPLKSNDWMKTTEDGREGVRWREGEKLADLDFADDLALLSENNQDLQHLTTKLEQFAGKVGLRISIEKTKTMEVGDRADQPRLTISVYNTQVETVDQFTYLGSVLSNSGEVEPDISCRLGKAAAVFRRMRTIWATSAIDLDTKLRLYNSIVLPTAIYASETWKCTAKLTKKLDVFHQRNLRRILKVRWQDHITNEEILRRAKTQPLGDIITGKRMQLAGHILRLSSQRHSKTAMTWVPPGGRRKRGRPKNTWRRTFQEDLKRANIAWEEAEEAAATRTRWKLAAQCACRHRRT